MRDPIAVSETVLRISGFSASIGMPECIGRREGDPPDTFDITLLTDGGNLLKTGPKVRSCE